MCTIRTRGLAKSGLSLGPKNFFLFFVILFKLPVFWESLYTSVADPHWFQCGSGYGSRSKGLMTKNWKTFTAEIKFIFFWSKISINFSLGHHKWRPSYWRSLHPSKEYTLLELKLKFSSILWVILAFLNPDPYSQWRRDPGTKIMRNVYADPDPNDPSMQCCGSESGSTGSTCFGPPGSGFINQMDGSGSGSYYHHAKIVRTTLSPTILRLFLTA